MKTNVLLQLLGNKWRYRLKENYITAHVNTEWWEGHINYMLLQQYASSLTGKVADFGCNHGACTILAARNPLIRSVTGIDFNRAALQEARNLLSRCGESPDLKKKVSYAEAMLSALPFEDDCFDNGYMFHVIEHIYPKDRPQVLAEIRRVIRPGGHLLFALPYDHAYDDGTQHVAFFDTGSFASVLKQAGFDVKECYRDRRTDAHTPEGHDCITALALNMK
jgi:SAM-dependent methyltransferase